MQPTYFPDATAFRDWLARHAARAPGLLVGFHKVGSGLPSLRWPEAVDEALCVGWIDGIRHRIDDQRYQIRFTPRRPGSTWSAVNIERVAVLTAAGRMQPAGLAVFAQRRETRSRTASYEQATMPRLSADAEARFRADAPAWAYFDAQPPSYRRRVLWWVTSAKQPATQARRLARLIAQSAAGQRL